MQLSRRLAMEYWNETMIRSSFLSNCWRNFVSNHWLWLRFLFASGVWTCWYFGFRTFCSSDLDWIHWREKINKPWPEVENFTQPGNWLRNLIRFSTHLTSTRRADTRRNRKSIQSIRYESRGKYAFRRRETKRQRKCFSTAQHSCSAHQRPWRWQLCTTWAAPMTKNCPWSWPFLCNRSSSSWASLATRLSSISSLPIWSWETFAMPSCSI